MYDAVLFDNDGVLVGRTRFDALREAAYHAFAAVGVDDPDPDLVDAVAAGTTPTDVARVCDRYDLDPGTFWRARDRTASEVQVAEAHAGRKTPYDDVGAIRDLDVPLGIVSSNQQATIDFLLDHFGLAGRFETAYGREPELRSLDRKKPDPHYLERALEDLSAETALFVGDNESDLAAADNAGIDSAFLRRPHRRDAELSREPTYELDDLHDLVAICASRGP